MEALIIAVGLFLVYTVLNRFEVAIDSVVDASNNKAKVMAQEVAAKATRKRSKLATKIADEDIFIISNKELDDLLAGKTKDTPKETKK